MPTTTLEFRTPTTARIERITYLARQLGEANSLDDAIRALFLLHSELKDCESSLPPPVVTLDTLRAEFVRAQDNVAALRARIEGMST